MTAAAATVLPFPLHRRRHRAATIAAEIARDWGLMWPLFDALECMAVSRMRDAISNKGRAAIDRDLRAAHGHLTTAIERDVALRRDDCGPSTITAADAAARLLLPWQLARALEEIAGAIDADSRAVARGRLEMARMMVEGGLFVAPRSLVAPSDTRSASRPDGAEHRGGAGRLKLEVEE